MKKVLLVCSLLALPFATLTFTGCSTVKETNSTVNDANSTTNSSLNAASRTQSTANRIAK